MTTAMSTALAISPHLDDAVFSAGGTLAHLATAGWRVVMATVFTASVPEPKGFALACQLDKGLSPEVDYMGLRRDEDLTAADELGVEAVHLPDAARLPVRRAGGFGRAALRRGRDRAVPSRRAACRRRPAGCRRLLKAFMEPRASSRDADPSG